MSTEITPLMLFSSLLGGILPAVVWLLFWLKEDTKRPEPRGIVMLSFVCGMIAVPLAIPLQHLFISNDIVSKFFLWATIEELLKFIAAYTSALWRKSDDEPIDPLIYMVTSALGFSALENALFILQPLIHGASHDGLLIGDIRFVGASLLHTISSATIGIAMGLSFYKSIGTKITYLSTGIIVAIALHTTFNFFIMNEAPSIRIATYGFVWIAIIVLMLFFERIKKVYPVNTI